MEPETYIARLFRENQEKVNKAKAKYSPLVKSLTDMDFVGLYEVVMQERSNRLIRLMVDNPPILKLAVDKIKDQTL